MTQSLTSFFNPSTWRDRLRHLILTYACDSEDRLVTVLIPMSGIHLAQGTSQRNRIDAGSESECQTFDPPLLEYALDK